MALLLPAVLAGGAYLLYSDTENRRRDHRRLEQNMLARAQSNTPYQGVYTPAKQYWGAQTRGRFTSLQRETDVNGAEVFLVNYGNGSQVYQYVDPRIVW